jgi:hypothetical protein
MTDESRNKESASQEKLLIDKPSDFKFHLAYITYSDTYDKTTNPETKRQLDQNTRALQQNQIDYPTFYKNIDQYRTENGSQHNYGRALIKTEKTRMARKNAKTRKNRTAQKVIACTNGRWHHWLKN